MQIETRNLIIRDHRPEDWVDIHEYSSIPEFSQYDIWGPNTEEDSKNFVNLCISESKEENRYKYNLAIEEKSSGKVIGGVGFRRAAPDSSYADLGYAINPVCQGKGYATEAAKAIIDFAFEELGLNLIYA